MVRFRFISVVVLAVALAGCGASRNRHIRRQAGRDLSCSERYVKLSTLSKAGAQYLAEACGRRAVYTYSRQTGPVRISAIEGPNLSPGPGAPVGMPPPGSNEVPPPPPPPPPPAL